MSSDGWVRCKLGDISKNVAYGYTASAQSEPVGPKFLRITDIVNGLNWDTVPYCEITPENHEKYKLEPGDIVVARTGATTGTTEIIKEDRQSVFASYLIRFKIDETIANPYYVGYILKSSSWWDFVKSSIGGSAQPGANATVLSRFEFLLPPLPTQQQIVEILSVLDDKIELNRQTNATLEAIAQAIFKEWFVDFNYPGATGEMVDSELGPIPKGWRIKPLDEIADFLNGLALQKFPPENETEYLPVIKIRELRNGVTESSDQASRKLPKDYIIQDGDLLFSWSGSLEVKFWVGGEGALNQHLFKVTSKNFPPWFCYHWILHHLTNFRNIAEEKTTTMGHIKREHLSNALCLVPEIIDPLDPIIQPIFSKMLENEKESQLLIKTRELLLPELMNGRFEL